MNIYQKILFFENSVELKKYEYEKGLKEEPGACSEVHTPQTHINKGLKEEPCACSEVHTPQSHVYRDTGSH